MDLSSNSQLYQIVVSNIEVLPYDFALRGFGGSNTISNTMSARTSLLPAHRALLVITCQYFKQYFQDHNNEDVAVFQQFSQDDLITLLKVLYKNQLPVITTVEQYVKFQNLISFFGVKLYDYIWMLVPTPIPTSVLQRLLDLNIITNAGEVNYLGERLLEHSTGYHRF
jgi:hypothetical protein